MKHKPTIYRVWYNGQNGKHLVYIGRTKNNLTERIRQHHKKHPFQKVLKIDENTYIDYTEFNTVADMFVAEIILINQHKPPLNVDDKAKDELTLDLQLLELDWKVWDKPHLVRKWNGETTNNEI